MWLLTFVVRYKTLKLVLATAMCVVFVPADMLNQVLSRAIKHKPLRIAAVLLVSWAALAWPFVSLFAFDEPSLRRDALVGYWVFLVAYLVLSAAFAATASEDLLSRTIPNASETVACSGHNALALVSIVAGARASVIIPSHSSCLLL